MKAKGQGAIEYIWLSIVVVAAIVGISVYFGRGVSGKIKLSGEQLSGGIFYAPAKTTGHTEVVVNITQRSSSEGKTNKSDSLTTRSLEQTETVAGKISVR